MCCSNTCVVQIQTLTDPDTINRGNMRCKQARKGWRRTQVWLPVCVFTDNHFMVNFQDSFSSSSMRKFLSMFGLIFLAVERVSANRCGCGVSLLPGRFSLSEGFSPTRASSTTYCRRKESDFKVLENPGTSGRKGNLMCSWCEQRWWWRRPPVHGQLRRFPWFFANSDCSPFGSNCCSWGIQPC